MFHGWYEHATIQKSSMGLVQISNLFSNPFRAGDDERDQNDINTVIVIVWIEGKWVFSLQCMKIWTSRCTSTDLPNCCVSFTKQSLSMLWRSAREHCDGADGARHAHKFDFPVRISYKFTISDCRGDSDLGLHSSWHLAQRMPQRSGRICCI